MPKEGFYIKDGKYVAVDDATRRAKVEDAIARGDLLVAIAEMPEGDIVVTAFATPEKLYAALVPLVDGLRIQLSRQKDIDETVIAHAHDDSAWGVPLIVPPVKKQSES